MNKDKIFTWMIVAYICASSIKMVKELTKEEATDDLRKKQSIL